MRNILNWRNIEKEFNIGDRVRLKSNGSIVEVVIAKDGWIAYDENRRIAGSCPMEEVEPVDPKTAFLSELKGLLEKHNAEIIGGGFDGYGDYLQVRLGNESPFDVGEDNQYDGVVLTADNIMDYNKEWV